LVEFLRRPYTIIDLISIKGVDKTPSLVSALLMTL
jgi:hypothetical protein